MNVEFIKNLAVGFVVVSAIVIALRVFVAWRNLSK